MVITILYILLTLIWLFLPYYITKDMKVGFVTRYILGMIVAGLVTMLITAWFSFLSGLILKVLV